MSRICFRVADSTFRISEIGFVRKRDSASFDVNVDGDCGGGDDGDDDGGGGDCPATLMMVVDGG